MHKCHVLATLVSAVTEERSMILGTGFQMHSDVRAHRSHMY